MAYASLSRRALVSLTVATALTACSASDLVPPESIDTGTRVGAISPVRDLPREPITSQAYPGPSAPVSQASSGYAGRTPAGDAYTGDSGYYLKAPDQVQSAPLGSPSAASSQLPMIDSDEAMAGTSPAGAMTIPQGGINIDEELGFGPDESDVTGLAEEQDTDIAEGLGDQPVVDGIGTDNPVALTPKRQPAPIKGDYGNGTMTWGDGSRVVAPSRVPMNNGLQEVAMVHPDKPTRRTMNDGPMSRPDTPWQREAMPKSEVGCRAELRRLGVEFQDRPRIGNGRSCGIAYPVKLSGLSGNIDVKPAVTLNCQVTLAFAKWVKNELAPSARLRYLTGVKKIVPMGGYSCRRMKNSRQRNNPMSEHAKGNAIDIGRIVLKSGQEIDVRKKGLFSFREGGLLKAVRSDSCKYFNTVLGPGSNAEHWNHFHFDLRSRKSGRRYCS